MNITETRRLIADLSSAMDRLPVGYEAMDIYGKETMPAKDAISQIIDRLERKVLERNSRA